MSAEVVKFYPKGSCDSADAILEQAVGVYDTVLIIGFDKGGDLDSRSTTSDGRTILWLIESLKHQLLSGEYQE